MRKIGCLENAPNQQTSIALTRQQFWAAFGEEAPSEPKVEVKKKNKFWKRFCKKFPDACAKVAVRTLLVVAVFSVLYSAGLNPVRFLVSKFI